MWIFLLSISLSPFAALATIRRVYVPGDRPSYLTKPEEPEHKQPCIHICIAYSTLCFVYIHILFMQINSTNHPKSKKQKMVETSMPLCIRYARYLVAVTKIQLVDMLICTVVSWKSAHTLQVYQRGGQALFQVTMKEHLCPVSVLIKVVGK